MFDDRPIGRIGFCQLDDSIQLPLDAIEFPSQFASVAAARKQQQSHIDLATLTHADLPVWIASQQTDSVGLLNANVLHETVKPIRPIGRIADQTIFPPPLGAGRWAISTYYDLLNAGLRISPSAGSGSGTVDNPVGYNRVYVHCGDEFTWDRWWQGLRQGRSLITNGPMLRPRINGELPGHVFRGYPGETVTLESSLNLSTKEKIAYLQIIKNGETTAEVRLDEFAKAQGVLPEVAFTESGWLLIRAVCENSKALRYATTAPYYVEFDGKPRISERSCQFLLDWSTERLIDVKTNLKQQQNLSARQRHSVVRYHEAGVKFWENRLKIANAP